MSQMLTQIATLSLVIISIVFYFTGFFLYRFSRITEENSVGTYGTLVGFRRYYTTDQWGDNTEDYPENRRGRVPIVNISLNGESVDIASVASNYSLTKDDIGKQVKIRYRRFIGIKLIIDDGDSLRNYNQLQNTLFWVFMSVATILLIIGIVAHFLLPKILGGIAF